MQLVAKESRAEENNRGIRCFFVLFIDKRYIFQVSFHFIFIYLGTVAPSVHENCFSGGRGSCCSCRVVSCRVRGTAFQGAVGARSFTLKWFLLRPGISSISFVQMETSSQF